ncbi:hypothetical protein SpCBS45565_g07226 [Spizellomyces sp. 'palustris']|nr:hypothetical protein SpCBS45565_g07226 [Spizellomyces sp. 'palustris']
MIEVDVFWSFAFGASFAACAASTLSVAPSPFVNRPFVLTLLFLSLLFVPSGTYLLDRFPGWESMFLFTSGRDAIPPLLTTAFTLTNSALGILGFYLTYNYIRAHRDNLAHDPSYHKYWIHAYSCFTAILGMGYYRFTYPGTHRDWNAGITFPMTQFVFSPVFNTLLAMGIIFVPVIYYLMYSLASETFQELSKRQAATNVSISAGQIKKGVLSYILRTAVVDFIAISCAWGLAMNTQYVDDVSYFEHGWAGKYAPLVGFAVGHLVVFGLVLVPIVAIRPARDLKKSQ